MGCHTTFTVFFDDPFWVGVIEINDNGALYAARHVFGAEPTGPELHRFALGRDFDTLARRALAGPPGVVTSRPAHRVNPKRAARRAARQAADPPLSTAAQQALKRTQEQARTSRKVRSREQREAAAEERRRAKVAKAKARHRGH